MGTWFRDYLYIPLGGNRCGTGRNILNLFIVWFLTGLWHGANYTFVLWGMMYFCLLVFERLTGFYKAKGNAISIFKWFYTIFFVVTGWVIFRSDSIKDAFEFLRKMFGLNGNPVFDGLFSGWFSQNVILISIGFALCTPLIGTIQNKVKGNLFFEWIKTVAMTGLFVLSIASLVSSSYNPFIYFHF